MIITIITLYANVMTTSCLRSWNLFSEIPRTLVDTTSELTTAVVLACVLKYLVYITLKFNGVFYIIAVCQ